MKAGRATIAAVCGGLVIVAGLLWWQSAFGLTSLPGQESEPTAVGQTDPTQEAGTLEGEGKLQPGDPNSESDREQIASRPLEKPAAKSEKGSLLLSVVYGDDNSPAAGIGVIVTEVTRHGPRASRRHVKTDAKGSVLITDLFPGRVYLRTDRKRMNGEVATVVAGEEAKFTITLKGGIHLTGVVVDTDGVTVADAEIILAGWGAMEPEVVARSDDRGRFALRQVARMVNLGARARGHAPSPLRTISAGAGAKVEVRVVLPGPGGGVSGQVVDPNGRGVPDTEVKIGPLERDLAGINLPDGSRGMNARAAETRTDAEGRFEVTGLAVGKIPVLARASSFAPWVGSVHIVAHVTTPLVIRLQPGVTCEGTVCDDKGVPAPGVDVDHGNYGTPSRRATRTAADGSYRLQGLPTGEITVKARGRERGNTSVKLNGRSGETLRWDPRLSRGVVLQGVVMDQANQSLQHVGVLARGAFVKGASHWFRHVGTDKDGKFVLVDCPSEGSLSLELQKKEYITRRGVQVDPAVGNVALRMEYAGKATARIIGTVLDPDGKPVPDAGISAFRGGGGGGRVYTTTAAGKIDIGSLTPGVYRLYVRGGRYPRYLSPEHQLATGETWDVGTVRLVRGACVRVHVSNAEQLAKAKQSYYLSLRKTDGTQTAGINTRQQLLKSEPVVPGRYVLAVSGPLVIPANVPVTVGEGQDTAVKITVRTGVPRVLEFVLPDGTDKIKRLEMTLAGGDGFNFTRRVSRWRPGPFRLTLGLAPGHYKLDASTKEGYRGQLEFDVPAGQSAEETVRVNLE